MCRFLVAGKRRLTTRSSGRRPKSAKARSRGQLGTGWQQAYGDRMSAPLSMVGASAAPDEVHVGMQWSPRECNRHLGGNAECINGRSVDGWTAPGREAATRIAEHFHNFRVSA